MVELSPTPATAVVETMPNAYQLSVIERAATLRGAIITSYAQVEFLLGDIVMRCMDIPEYAFLPRDFPQRFSVRLKRVADILAAAGPLADLREPFEAIMAEMVRYEELRHFMAHGLLRVFVTGASSHSLEYRMWRQRKGRPPEEGKLETNLEHLGDAAHQVAGFSGRAVRLFRDTYLGRNLQPV